jgi:hypothetical protein
MSYATLVWIRRALENKRIKVNINLLFHFPEFLSMRPQIFIKRFIDENPEFMKNKIDDILIIPLESTTFKAQMGAWMRSNSCRKLKTNNLSTLILHGKKGHSYTT